MTRLCVALGRERLIIASAARCSSSPGRKLETLPRCVSQAPPRHGERPTKLFSVPIAGRPVFVCASKCAALDLSSADARVGALRSRAADWQALRTIAKTATMLTGESPARRPRRQPRINDDQAEPGADLRSLLRKPVKLAFSATRAIRRPVKWAPVRRGGGGTLSANSERRRLPSGERESLYRARSGCEPRVP